MFAGTSKGALEGMWCVRNRVHWPHPGQAEQWDRGDPVRQSVRDLAQSHPFSYTTSSPLSDLHSNTQTCCTHIDTCTFCTHILYTDTHAHKGKLIHAHTMLFIFMLIFSFKFMRHPSDVGPWATWAHVSHIWNCYCRQTQNTWTHTHTVS